MIYRQTQEPSWPKGALHRGTSLFHVCVISNVLSWVPTPEPETPFGFSPAGEFFLDSHQSFFNHVGIFAPLLSSPCKNVAA